MQRDHWYLTEGLIFCHFAVFFLVTANPDARYLLAMVPSAVGSQPWRLLTFQFLHGGMFWFFISMLVLWIMARPLEESWGSLRFLVFWLVSVLGASGTAAVLGQPLAGDVFLSTSLLFTYATLFPDTEFYMFFILPVKVKWLALLGGGYLVLSSFVGYGLITGVANVAGMSAGYLFFLATRRLPSRRKLAFELAKRKNQAKAAVESSATEQRNRGFDERARAAAQRAGEHGEIADEDEQLLGELDGARNPEVTVCAPPDFGWIDDPVCRSCQGYPECAARAIRRAAQQKKKES